MFLIVVLLLLFLALLITIVIALYLENSEKKIVLSSLDSVLFLVMMPKQELKKANEATQEEKALISHMEQVLANFLGLKQKMFQPAPTIALEIASQTGGTDISFYVAVPRYLETVFEKYVQGVYSEAVVQKVPEDYTVFEPQGQSAGAYLKLREDFLFPIATYQKLEKDPLSTITNNLS